MKLVSKLMSLFSPYFSGALVNPTALKRCCLKVLLEKAIQSRRFYQHCQILAFVLPRGFGLCVAPEALQVSASCELNIPISFSALSFYESSD